MTMPDSPTTARTDCLLVITTVDDRTLADDLAQELVEQRLAACVHILGAGRSVYRWQEEVEDAEEHTLLIKTSAPSYDSLQDWLAQRHPYETPELIALPITQGLPDYLDWIRQCTR
ncbi:Periplasmic divalent cation tolerance protein cutA [Thioalkalivibrio nitratireducens DSM 14787]|uniref:Periplasmic divalent cation tolerance protein cutA n=1 Tax=Thioalkalivibrio nitratireducens (strain DSM 14787 / UNIQEM 213 / ALEN2) TaxID=1255043 RepID=L0DT64_THIND|nr:divalent-cation tolerance protein CutA [Thioalkalivibrio nitratireducens]AGA32180.1 Periplasmic divalent cation tolerance protein cutA [Thioalkalivibrio nitratireducens DSM 14787]